MVQFLILIYLALFGRYYDLNSLGIAESPVHKTGFLVLLRNSVNIESERLDLKSELRLLTIIKCTIEVYL